MKFGKFEIYSLSDGTFKLDGGAMFGVVPKVFWEKKDPADEKNRVLVGLNPLLIRTGEKNIIIDTGIGDKWDQRFCEIYGVNKSTNLIKSLAEVNLSPSDIDIVINTHLHFDHAGGNTMIGEGGKIIPAFPNAKYLIQKGEWDDALNPNDRTKGSYLKENILPLMEHKKVEFLYDDETIDEEIKVIKTPGHNRNHQCVMLESEGRKAFYLGDLIPTSSHLQIAWGMGFDLFPAETMEIKKKILNQALEGKWLLVFEHDPRMRMGYLKTVNGKMEIERVE
ncbi:MAG: hypothetical protein A2149_09770 [Candidatus Schekmanbacteria bacterium RBG_16_38_11]|uniref:Metallo-beta-lactamase domain-containing protein n=1 Tax=Candidatus Schekmanbacteria bacterium RBG_16_38_11 TaxID=1817880 RepID=A0A1F7RTA7_9BACT|nr:MAG: hypothetical protein A2149_09770 [Candidatus Schekmanbacteria bacterium RBG_16_38_11]